MRRPIVLSKTLYDQSVLRFSMIIMQKENYEEEREDFNSISRGKGNAKNNKIERNYVKGNKKLKITTS